MRLKKANAVLGLLSVPAVLLHIGFTAYCYLTMSYLPQLKTLFSLPFMVLVCLHAVCGMASVFLLGDGTRLGLYPKQNRGTVIQRLSAALIFPLLFLHLRTFDLLKSTSGAGQWFPFILLILSEILFYGTVTAHTAVSFSKALITLGWLSSREKQKTLSRLACILGAVLFLAAAVIIIRGQLVMFVPAGGIS